MLALHLLFASHQSGEAVSLAHLYQKGEKATYEVVSTLRTESREGGIDTWFPDSLEYRYQFSFEIQDVGAQGVAKIRYRRPTITKVFAEQFDHPERTVVEKIDDDILMQISSANEIIEAQEVKKGTGPKASGANMKFAIGSPSLQGSPTEILKTFYGLALFTGSLESSVDFNPRLPFDKVKPGETWKRTASFAPQKLNGSKDMAVQRLDYVYTYVGRIQSEGKTVDRVKATLHLETDVAAFLHQKYKVTSAQTHLKSVPVLLDGTMEFDLDPTTRKALRATAKSTGNFKVITTDHPDQASYEERLKGETTMEPVAVVTKPPTTGKKKG